MLGGQTGIRPHSFGGEFFSKFCMACLIEIACFLTGRMILVLFSPCIYFFCKVTSLCTFIYMSHLQQKKKNAVNELTPQLR